MMIFEREKQQDIVVFFQATFHPSLRSTADEDHAQKLSKKRERYGFCAENAESGALGPRSRVFN